MKKPLLILFIALSAITNAIAQFAEGDTVIHLYISNDSVITSITANPGGTFTPHFTSAAMEAITAPYTFRVFQPAYPSSSHEYLRHFYALVCNDTAVAAQLKAAFPDIFLFYNLSGPIELTGVTDAYMSGGIPGIHTLLYPSPASGSLDINPTVFPHVTTIAAMDVTGRISPPLRKSFGCTVDITPLPNGVYWFRLSFDDRPAQTVKIVVLNK